MRVAVGLLGLLLGLLAGAVLLVLNPLAWFRGLPPLPADLAPAKPYRWDGYRGIELGATDLLGLGRGEPGVALADPALARVRVGIIVLPAGQGMPAALAVKVSTIAEENSLWRAQLGTHDYWSIYWPGEGSVFAASYSNYWNVVRDEFLATLRGSDPEGMSPAYPVSAPPPVVDAAGVTGAAGRYAGFTGEIRELLYPADKGPDWSIAIKANPPPVTRP